MNAVISALILAFIFTRIPVKDIVSLIADSEPSWFGGAILVTIASIWINAWRWQILLKYLGYEYDLRLLSKISFITFFFNVYLPGGVAGEVARIALLPDSNHSPEEKSTHLTRVTASVITDKVVGLIGIMLLAMFGFIFSFELLLNSQILFIFLLISAGIITLTIILYSRRIQRFIKSVFASPLKLLEHFREPVRKVIDSLLVYRDQASVFNRVIPISILGHILVVFMFVFLAQSVGVSIEFFKMFVFIPIIEFVSNLPISLGGLGIREATTILLFGTAQIPADQAMGVSLLSFAAILLVGLPGGAFYFFRKSIRKIIQEAEKN